MKRIFHRHEEREECSPDGMWRNVAQHERDVFAEVTAELMRFADKFEKAMMRVLDEWPKSCEQNLSAAPINKLAWLGHAGCFLHTGSPEDATRLGWHLLDGPQQLAANRAANRVLDEWVKRRRNGVVGQARLF